MLARLAGVLFLALLLFPAAPVDATEDLTVDPRAFAWYAHGAAAEGRVAAIDNLRAYLRRTARERERPVFFARSCAVDALIRLEAALPGKELASLARHSFDEAAAILAVRFATPEAALLEFEAMDRVDWFTTDYGGRNLLPITGELFRSNPPHHC